MCPAELPGRLAALLAGEDDPVAAMANAAALLGPGIPGLNWLGFYRPVAGGDLLLGPFWGAPACVRLPAGRGVCQAALAGRASVVVDDVHAFPGHIACDPRSRSEAVVPLVVDGRVVAVLDADAPTPARFDAPTLAILEAAAIVVADACRW